MYIDCARGYAVLMVIACHLAYEFPGLPYPVKRVVTQGWFGVQLFFLASCLTLLMSWRAELARTGSVNIVAFFTRRLFRIAPAYYAAALLYFWLVPPPGGFDAWQALASAAFVNAWHPVWAPTVAGAWSVVPGGWSIGVEFTFYAAFPLFAAYTTTARRAGLVLLGCIGCGIAANLAARGVLSRSYDDLAVSNFLFFWFPNQASVFALGGLLFFLVRATPGLRPAGTQGSTALALAAIIGFCALGFLPLGHYLGDRPLLPAGLLVCLPLMAFVLALSGGSRVFVNRVIAAIGQVSFSAYLLHFAVLRLVAAYPGLFHPAATSYPAILAYGFGFLLVTSITYAVAWLSYRAIERPMIGLGKRLIERSRQRYSPA
jgi:peptidoglycan/LPS O-acetylase OafA/YrhL